MTVVFNAAKGKVAYYAGLPAAADKLVVVPLEATGLVTDDMMADYTTLAALLAGASNEQTTIGRKDVTSVTVTPDNTANTQTASFSNLTWTAATGNPVGALVVCYDPTGSSADSALIPLTAHTWAVTPNGTDVTATVSAGFFGAS